MQIRIAIFVWMMIWIWIYCYYNHLYYYRYNIPDKYHRCLYDKDNCVHCRYLHPVNREMHNHELFANFHEFFVEFFDTWLPVLIPAVFCYPDVSMFHTVFHLEKTNKFNWEIVIVVDVCLPSNRWVRLTSRQSFIGKVLLSNGSAHFGSESEWHTQHFIPNTNQFGRWILNNDFHLIK